MSLADAMELGAFQPATIQRQYQWTSEQVAELLDDLLGAFQTIVGDPEAVAESGADDGGEAAQNPAEDQHAEPLPVDGERVTRPLTATSKRMRPDVYFLGGMIFYRVETGRTLYVYDGLQRLVTLNLLFAQLRDGWASISAQEKRQLDGLLFENGEQRLTFASLGRALNPIIRGDQRPSFNGRTEGEENVLAAVRFLRSIFADWSDTRRSAFLTFLSHSVWLSVTEVTNPTVAYQMFNGANDRGLRLSVADVLKGVFAEQIRLGAGTTRDVDRFAQLWRDAQLDLKKGFDTFLHSIEVLKFRPEDRHTTGEYLEKLFADGTPAKEILAWFEGDFSRMVEAAKRTRVHLGLRISEGVDIAFRQLSFLGWHDWQPLYLAIAVAHRGAFSTRSFASEMQVLQRACYIAELFDWSEAMRRKKFSEAVALREQGSDPFRRVQRNNGPLHFPSRRAKETLKEKLRAPLSTDSKRGAIVRWIETLHWGAELPREVTDDATVEHILPRTARDEWLTMFTEAEREAHTHRLGNLCILSERDNHEAANKEWPLKKEIYLKRSPATKGPELVLAASTAAEKSGDGPWSADTIGKLTEYLAKIAQRALGI